MNILFITHYTSLMGANRSMLAAIDYLTLQGCKCHVLCPEEGDIVEELEARRLGYFFHKHYLCQEKVREKESKWDFYKRTLRMQYYGFRTMQPIGDYLAKHQIQLIYSNSSVISIGLLAALKYKVKHLFHLREFGDKDYGLTPVVPRFLFKHLLLLSDRVVCISEALKEHFFGSAHYDKVVRIYNGIYTSQQLKAIEKAKPIVPNKKIVHLVIVGILIEEKGQHHLLQAFNYLSPKYPELRLHLVGPGDEAYYKGYIQDKDVLEKVFFHGYVKNTDFIYEQADIAFICSKNEAFGRVIVEAMAWGVPILGYNNAGIAELISHAKTGLLYNEDAPESIAQLTEFALQNPALLEQTAHNARAFIQNRFTVEEYGRQLYEEIKKMFSKQ